METNTAHQSIALWNEDDRPREKLLNKGRNALSDAELLAIILGSGSRNESALELAKRILAQSGNFSELASVDFAELTAFKGVGPAKAISVLACMEISRRARRNQKDKKTAIQSSKQAYDMLYPHLSDLHHEEFWILLLNRANHLIRPMHISRGGLSGTVADAKIIFKLAIENRASSIILAHNHPSGNRKPSNADIKLTKQIIKAGELLDIAVLDHVILAGESYFSFADEGMMSP